MKKIGCSHTGLYLPAPVFDSLQHEKCLFPYPLYLVADKLLVNISGHNISRGSQIISVNGRPAKDIIRDLSLYEISDGTKQQAEHMQAAGYFSMDYFFRYGPAKDFKIVSIDTNGLTTKNIYTAISLEELDQRNADLYYYDGASVPYDLYLDEKTGYALMRITTFKFEDGQESNAFDNFCYNSFELLRSKPVIRSLIIDVRGNHGGYLSDASRLFSYITNAPFRSEKNVSVRMRELPYTRLLSDMNEGDISRGNEWLTDNFMFTGKGRYVMPDSLIDDFDPEPDRFRGSVFVIINTATASAASTFAGMVKYSGRGKLVGTYTIGGEYCGSGFKELTYILPNSGIQLYFPVAHIIHYYHTKKNSGRTVSPDYNIPDNELSFQRNEDCQVNFIVDSLLKRK